jgi:hypothetical protein
VTFIPSPFVPDPSPAYTWPRRPPQPPQPLTQDQDEQRQRRRNQMCIHYRAAFDLAREISDICEPLAADLATMPDPAARGLRRLVEDVADAAHEAVSTAVGMLAESRTLMGDDGARSRATTAVRDLATRPAAPDISDKRLINGSWPAVLTDLAAPCSADLAVVLGHSLAPGDERLRGRPSASERVESVLRGLDHAAAAMAKAMPAFRRQQTGPTFAEHQQAQREQRETEAVQRKLARLEVRR